MSQRPFSLWNIRNGGRGSLSKAIPFALLTLLLIILGSCGGAEKVEKVAYVSAEDGNQDIYLFVSDDDPRRLTSDPARDHSPRLSPDGQFVAFVSDRNGNEDIFVIDITGEELVQITDSPGDDSSPRWSPDGKMLAYLSRSQGEENKIFITDVDQPEPHRLTSEDMDEGPPAWSPDGRWIAFPMTNGEGVGQGIFLRNPGGVNQLRVTEGNDFLPTWSPDARSIAFQSLRDGNHDIYVVDVGEDSIGGGPRRLTNHQAIDLSPAWSPKDDGIAFISQRDGNPEIYVISSDGTLLRRLTMNEADEETISWSRDGRLTFVSHLHGNADVFVMDADGDNQAQLTYGTHPDTQPHW